MKCDKCGEAALHVWAHPNAEWWCGDCHYGFSVMSEDDNPPLPKYDYVGPKTTTYHYSTTSFGWPITYSDRRELATHEVTFEGRDACILHPSSMVATLAVFPGGEEYLYTWETVRFVINKRGGNFTRKRAL